MIFSHQLTKPMIICYHYTMKNKFPERLKELRQQKGLSQREIIKILPIQITQSGYCLWENGKAQPTLENLMALCIFFDVSADYITGLSDV